MATRNRRISLQQHVLRHTTRDASHGQVAASTVNLSSIDAETHGIALADLRRAELLALSIAALIPLTALGGIRRVAMVMVFGGAMDPTREHDGRGGYGT
ncbi:hypothetical protein LX15_001067 [Streptoalloteichus tenebrarius]|uniref:Uncharacterized protein n=1 Tax=Streptoalloteichus tenebrarius (strain ATCC 17920 / DSM 40477 / JCM 4838 / CBS 697.72 / NBRC 16177 / NCIMB 11028 / NRRL B-12390 / A12253. 1 / ISP 5477) TaxID=1933 RepID=A0ABT1HPE4_STRSD|nr:hypothetical protein [Streptoalloteichus tenebrarius]MCP2257382.1 hypothetical protein [Streptoalloteichus tenebrarius]BFE98328.1 hypothetical protein GCM10020241_00040 [Streptoalloteichus tenebrarius]